ncbi:GIY-YIG nuclease family protein [Candidatus Kaiserbacteria bacterium]|nr:GIY-YIG nuclease family protein [Candidatus Kaiserbacteria bacterium]
MVVNRQKKKWYVYILRCNDDSLYTGVTTDPVRRETEHNQASVGAKYTKMRRPVKIVYQETAKDRSSAQKREAILKKMPRSHKLTLIDKK